MGKKKAVEEPKKERKHKRFGGSAIELTALCPGSVKAKKEVPRTDSPAAARGTRIHDWLEKFLKKEMKAIGGKLSERDKEEATIGAKCGKIIQDLAAEFGFAPSDLVIEQELDMSEVHEEAGGTPDVYAFRAFGDLILIDLKSGRNFVDADRNLQGRFYGVCALGAIDPFTRATLQNFHFYIVQPEQEAPYEVHVRRWSCTIQDLENDAPFFKQVIERAVSQPDLRIAGEHCENKYCDARTTCPVYANWMNEGSLGRFAIALQQPQELLPVTAHTPIDLAKILDAKPFIIKFLEQAEEAALAALTLDPNAVPGFTLVDKGAKRQWENEAFVEKKAKEFGLKLDDYKPRILIGPAPFEKLLKAKEINEALPPTVSNSSGKKVAKVSTPIGLAALAATAPTVIDVPTIPSEPDPFAALI